MFNDIFTFANEVHYLKSMVKNPNASNEGIIFLNPDLDRFTQVSNNLFVGEAF